MNSKLRALGMLTFGLLLVTGLTVLPVNAASSFVEDPFGDAAPAYLDIVTGKVTEQQGQGRLFFMQEAAGPVPQTPSEGFLNWTWNINTAATAPRGVPFEYVVSVEWTGSRWEAKLNDRTPLLNGGAMVRVTIPFNINGATVKAYVDLALLGNPSSFDWRATTHNQHMAMPIDVAPANGLVMWSR
jgi:hypothetical protein